MTEPAQTVATTENANPWAVRKKKIRTVAIFALYALVVVRQVNGKRFELKACGNHIADVSKKDEKMEINKKSVNGGSQVSGGFIFDQMDRFAHDYLKKEQNIKGYLFTECAHIYYSKQICDFGNVKIVPYETCDVGSATVVTVKAVDKKDKKEYATGMFFFVEKDHAYCDTEGE